MTSFISKSLPSLGFKWIPFITFLLFHMWSTTAHSQAISKSWFANTSILAVDAFKTHTCDLKVGGGVTFYRNLESLDEPEPAFALVDSNPGSSYISLKLGLKGFAFKGVCLDQSTAWKFGAFGPQLYYSLEYTYDSLGNDPLGIGSTNNVAFGLGAVQPFLKKGGWSGEVFAHYDLYNSIVEAPLVNAASQLLDGILQGDSQSDSTRVWQTKFNEHFFTGGLSVAFRPDPGFFYQVELSYQKGLTSEKNAGAKRAISLGYATNLNNAVGDNHVFAGALNTLTALGPARTPAAQFAIAVSGISQFSKTGLPYYQTCRSGRNGMVFLHAIDSYLADQCYGFKVGLRYALSSWSEIETTYIELGTDYLIGKNANESSYWQNWIASLSALITPYEGSNIGGRVLLGYPILETSAIGSFFDRVNFRLDLYFNF